MIALFVAALVALDPSPTQQQVVPYPFQGTWDAYPAACDYLVSDMRLGIEPAEFSIYRDQFRIENVVRKADGSLILSVAYRAHDDLENRGFGKPYELVWKLSESKNELTMTSSKGSTKWQRCPGKTKGN